MFGGDNRLFAIFEVDVIDEALDQVMNKMGMAQNRAQDLSQSFQMMGQGSSQANDNIDDTNQQFGKMFGIGMNVLFLGMALNMVFGRMARNVLSMTGASAALSAGLQSVLLPFFIAITPMVLKLSQAMMNLPNSVKMIIGAFVGLMAVLGPLLMIAGQIALLAISGLSLGMIATAVGTVVGAIAILITGFKLGMAIGRRFSDEIRFAMDVAATMIMRLVTESIGLLKNLYTVLEQGSLAVLNIFTGNFDAAGQNIKNMFGALAGAIMNILRGLFLTDIVEMLALFSKSGFDAGKDFVKNLADGIISSHKMIINAIKSIMPGWMIEGLKMGVFGPAGFATGAAMDLVSVNDFILSDGKLIQPDKRDTIIGGKPGGPIAESAGGGNVTVNINDPVMKEDVDVQRVVDEVEDRVNRDTRGRSGGIL